MEITINALSSKDINKLINKLKQLQKNLPENINKCQYKVVDDEIDNIYLDFNSLDTEDLDGNVIDDLDVNAATDGYSNITLSASGKDLAYIEFGTGKNNQPHPSYEWLEKAGWLYGVGDKINSFGQWFYNWNSKDRYGEEPPSTFKVVRGSVIRTIGMDSRHILFDHSQVIRNKLLSRRTYKGLLKKALGDIND